MLVNERLANKKVATIYGYIEFNEKGETKDLTVAQRRELGKLPGFRYVEEKRATTARKTVKKAETKTTTVDSNKKEPTKK